MLSVVVPVYNTSAYLPQCIDSLLNQTFDNIEIILVDDGSTDESPDICDTYAQNHHNIKVIHKENGGLISAWVAGTEAANREFVGYLDSDDYICEDYYHILMQPIIDYNCDISMCGFTKMNSNRDVVHPAYVEIHGLYTGNELEKLKHNFYNNVNIQNSRCIKVFRKELVMKNIHLIDKAITLGEDMTITVPCVLDAGSIYVNNSYCGYCYRMNEQSMSHLFNPKLIKNYQRLFDNVITSFEQKGYLNHYVYENFTNEFITVVGLIAFSDNTKKERIIFFKDLKSLPCSEVVLKHNCKAKLSWKILKWLIRINAFRTICAFADLKKFLVKEG